MFELVMAVFNGCLIPVAIVILGYFALRVLELIGLFLMSLPPINLLLFFGIPGSLFICGLIAVLADAGII